MWKKILETWWLEKIYSLALESLGFQQIPVRPVLPVATVDR